MLFDRLCGLAERHLHILEPILRKAKVFRFDHDPVKVLPKSFSQEEVTTFFEDFFLPFPVIAVEDQMSVVLLWDSKEKQRGVSGWRMFVEVSGFDDPALRHIKEKFRDPLLLATGRIRLRPMDNERFGIEGSATTVIAHRDGVVEIKGQEGVDGGLRNAATAIEEVFYFNNPTRFVVEVSNVTNANKPRSHGPKIPRSIHRPLYTLLQPKDIRNLMRISGQPHGDAERAPHWRRRHFRHLRSEYFTRKQGQLVVVESHWVGPTEAIVDGKLYKVRIDL